jgi:NhaP-type Na+/H+ or K+/H+ antiporter
MPNVGPWEIILLLLLLAVWPLPIYLCYRIGRRKGRKNAWLWGVFLGWIGVIVVALSGDKELESLEREVKMAELQRRKAELEK